MSLFSDIEEESLQERMNEGSMFNPYNRPESWREREEVKFPLKDDGDPKLFKED